MSLTPVINITTHDGPFHADEVLSVAILSTIFKNHTVTRSRDPIIIDLADFAVDVGGVYNHTLRRYDHHMTNPPRDESGHYFSSAGLIWYHYAKTYLQAINVPKEFTYRNSTISLHKSVERSIRMRWIAPIDRWDNGIHTGPTAISEVVSALAPTDPEKSRESYNDQFFKAVSMVSHLFERACFHAADHVIGKTIYLESDKEHHAEGRILVAETDIKDFGYFTNTDVNFAIYPVIDHNTQENHYNIRPINNGAGGGYKTPFPDSIIGATEDELVDYGFTDITFVHHTGFLAKARSKDAAIGFCLSLLE